MAPAVGKRGPQQHTIAADAPAAPPASAAPSPAGFSEAAALPTGGEGYYFLPQTGAKELSSKPAPATAESETAAVETAKILRCVLTSDSKPLLAVCVAHPTFFSRSTPKCGTFTSELVC